MAPSIMSSEAAPLVPRAAVPTIAELIGPFFIGIILNYFLWGVQITQSYYYYKTYRKTDNWWFKSVVALLFTFDAFQSICATQMGWNFMVGKWGDLHGITFVPDWGITMVPFTDALTASIVHVFYAHKIFVLLKGPFRWIIAGGVVLLSALQLGAATGDTGIQFARNYAVADFGALTALSILWLITASVIDIIITAVMTWKLKDLKSRTGFRETEDVISKLIRLTVETGMATAIVQIIDVVLFLIWPTIPYHTVPTTMAPKVYSNSVLAVLNSRESRRGNGQHDSRGTKMLDSSGAASTIQTVSIHNNYELQENIKPSPYSPGRTPYSPGRSPYSPGRPRYAPNPSTDLGYDAFPTKEDV